MEILKGHTADVRFAVPDTLASATYQVFKGDTQIGGSSIATVGNGVATCRIPYAAVTDDGLIKVLLNFSFEAQAYSQEKVVNVSTPYLDLFEVKDILETNDSTEAYKAEAASRHIINAHCGQSFGKYIGKLSVTGGGENALRLPRRLITLTDINDNDYWNEVVNIRGGGWYLQTKTLYGPPSIRADYHGYHYEPNTGVITAPPLVNYATFPRNLEFEINGVWGWEDVPERVREASKLLVNDYATGDSLYRDRFLTSMTAADWRIQFNDGAFYNTGNVRANQLLEEFVLQRGWVVV